MKKLILLILILSFFKTTFLYAQGNFLLQDNSSNDIVFALQIVQSNNQDIIEITREGGTPASASSTIPLVGDYKFETYYQICKMVLKAWNDIPAAALDGIELRNQLYQSYETWQIRNVEGKARLLNEDKIAGVLKVKSLSVFLVDSKKDLKCSDIANRQGVMIDKIAKAMQQIVTLSASGNPIPESVREIAEMEVKELEIRDVAFTISDNFIYSITIEGIVDGQEVTIKNNSWSLSLKDQDGQINAFTIGGVKYYFCYNDIFSYQSYPKTGAHSFYVKDEEFSLKPGEKRFLYKRSLNEYLGINISSDFLGINTDNASNLLTTDFNAILPLNIKQIKRARWVNHASARLLFTVLNGTNGSNGFKDISSIPKNEPSDPDSLFVDVFDLVRFQNVNLDLYLSVLGVEAKGINTIFHLGGGIDFHRSGLRHIVELAGKDSITDFNVLSSAPYLKILAQYRPDLNFGADLQYKLKRFTLLNNSNENPFIFLSDGVNRENERQFIPLNGNKKTIHSFELDLYGQVGSRAGLFARIGVDAIGFNSWNDNAFLRITIGYSTNLSAYINDVRKE